MSRRALKKVASTELDALEPFDFAATASAYNFSWYFDGERLLIPIASGGAVASVRRSEEGVLVELYSAGEVDEESALSAVSFHLGLREDLSEFWSLASRDPLLAAASERLRGMRLRSTDLWAAFVIATCQQNASFRQGWGMVRNLFDLLGARVTVSGRELVIPPSPSDVLKAGAGALKAAGVGYRAAAVVEGAKLFQVRGEELARMGREEFEEALCSLKGVGPYTARVAALFGLRRYEVNPVDRWLSRVSSAAYGVELSSLEEAEEFWASRWGRWTGLAAFFTTIVTDALPARKAVERVRKGELLPRSDLPHPTPMTLWRWA